jgi:putative solute:sodium symporter small subunit
MHTCPYCNAGIEIEVGCNNGNLRVDGVYTSEAYAEIQKVREARRLKKEEIAGKKAFLKKEIRDFESVFSAVCEIIKRALILFMLAVWIVFIFGTTVVLMSCNVAHFFSDFFVALTGASLIFCSCILYGKYRTRSEKQYTKRLESEYYAAHPESVLVRDEISEFEAQAKTTIKN